jgi:hypothetical protein
LGVVAAVDGSMKLKTEIQNFILAEETLYDIFNDHDPEEHDPEELFARDRILRIILDTKSVVDLKDTLSFLDDLLSKAVKNQSVERWVRCRQCKEKGMVNVLYLLFIFAFNSTYSFVVIRG